MLYYQSRDLVKRVTNIVMSMAFLSISEQAAGPALRLTEPKANFLNGDLKSQYTLHG